MLRTIIILAPPSMLKMLGKSPHAHNISIALRPEMADVATV